MHLSSAAPHRVSQSSSDFLADKGQMLSSFLTSALTVREQRKEKNPPAPGWTRTGRPQEAAAPPGPEHRPRSRACLSEHPARAEARRSSARRTGASLQGSCDHPRGSQAPHPPSALTVRGALRGNRASAGHSSPHPPVKTERKISQETQALKISRKYLRLEISILHLVV